MKIQNGSLKQFKRRDSKTGLKMQETGASQETDIGEIQFLFGALMTWKKSFALGQSRSSKNSQVVVKLQIFTESILITLQSLLNKAKEFLEESQKFLIAGSKVDQCHTLRVTTHSQ